MSHHSVDSTLDQNIDSSSSKSLYIMMEQDCITYSSCDYLHGDCDDCSCSDGSSCSDDSNCSSSVTIHDRKFLKKDKITPADRIELVDSCYAIVDQCNFQRDTVAFAMNIVDRFMSTSCASASTTRTHEVDALYDRAEYQLVTITALYISIKLNERTIFGSRAFTAVSRGTYSLEDIGGMELKILHALSWQVCPTTSVQVGNQILAMMLPKEAITKLEPGTLELLKEEMAFQTENAVRDYYFVTQRQSTIAVAAIMNAIQSVSNTIHDCGYLMEGLICILKRFSFDSSAVLLKVRHRLLRLMSEREDDENTSGMVSERTRVPPLEEKSWIPSAKEEALHPNDNNIYHSLVQLAQDNVEQTMPSPRLVIYEDTSDDDSCAAM